MKSHIPWRTVKSNPFNKDKFKGNYEEIQDWDLPSKVYIYEPQTLAELGDDADELDYQKLWNKFKKGGHLFIYLVPFREMPELSIDITSEGADWDGLNKNGVIAGFTNVKLPDRPTKRFYSFEPLTASTDPQTVELWEENNLSEIIDNDGGFKQTTFTFTKFEPFDGGEDSYYRDVRFYYGILRPKFTDHIEVDFGNAPTLIGSIIPYDVFGNKFDAKIDTSIENLPSYTFKNKWYNDTITGDWEVTETNYLTNNIDYLHFGSMRQNSDGYYEVNYSKSAWYPQLLVPKVGNTQVKWMAPWAWELAYLEEQKFGDYKFELLPNSDGTISDAGHSPNIEPSREDYFPGVAVSNSVQFARVKGYLRLKEGSIGGNGKRADFVKEYGVQTGLPFGLSSHGALYVKSDSEGSSGLLGLKYTDTGSNGIRPENAKGLWAGHTNMIICDYVYDPTVSAVDAMEIWLYNPHYGRFYQSEKYKELVEDIITGNPVYQGTFFTSEIGTLESIEDKNMPKDIRKWSEDDEWHMLLCPWNITTMTKDLVSNNVDDGSIPNILDSKIIPAPMAPKFDSGAFDDPIEIQTNAIYPYYGKYINEDSPNLGSNYIGNDKVNIPYKLSMAVDKDISSFDINYYAMKEAPLKISLFTNEGGRYILTNEFEVANEKAQGRTKSGGTSFTWL